MSFLPSLFARDELLCPTELPWDLGWQCSLMWFLLTTKWLQRPNPLSSLGRDRQWMSKCLGYGFLFWHSSASAAATLAQPDLVQEKQHEGTARLQQRSKGCQCLLLQAGMDSAAPSWSWGTSQSIQLKGKFAFHEQEPHRHREKAWVTMGFKLGLRFFGLFTWFGLEFPPTSLLPWWKKIPATQRREMKIGKYSEQFALVRTTNES